MTDEKAKEILYKLYSKLSEQRCGAPLKTFEVTKKESCNAPKSGE